MTRPSRPVVVVAPQADARLEHAATWLAEKHAEHVTLVAASMEAAAGLARRSLLRTETGAAFGWERTTLGVLALTTARTELSRRGLVPASPLALEAICSHVVHANESKLERFRPIANRPGFPRALARTVTELRLAGSPALDEPDLKTLLHAFERALDEARLTDFAGTLRIATDVVGAASTKVPPAHLLFIDVPLRTHAEQAFARAVSSAATSTFVTVPAGDDDSLKPWLDAKRDERDVPVASIAQARPEGTTALTRLQIGLFGEETDGEHVRGDDVFVFSAPGESREAIEIARIVLREAARGTPFDEMAVLLRTTEYRDHLEEAFSRAKIPAYFARGAKRPDPAGRALLTLLACAAEGQSARRFAEYLSLGEIPDLEPVDVDDARSPEASDDDVHTALLGRTATALHDEEIVEDAISTHAVEEERDPKKKPIPTPRHWERLLVTAAVIGERDRWIRRLSGLAEELKLDVAAYEAKGEDDLAEGPRRDLEALETLQRFALPIVDALAALPGGSDDHAASSSDASHASHATWRDWIRGLEAVARLALKNPTRVLHVLDELRPMESVGPVDITDVRLVLERRLLQSTASETGRRQGHVYIATIAEARGMAFDVVFVPGLAEKTFPQKVTTDPLLPDEARLALGHGLPTNVDRTEDERRMLRLAVGAAKKRVVFSYPRLDIDQARPKTPSFYGLEILRVAEGKLRGFEHLAEIAAKGAESRIGWPAPAHAEDAIDEAEHDLALLDAVLRKPEAESVGEAHYLLNANEHLARALRFRGRRWLKPWRACDGLVDPPEEALAAIRKHALGQRSFSPTALQNFAACPYRFFLSAVHKLSPRKELASIEDLDPLTKGSLVHEVQFRLLSKLREADLLPITKPRLETAYAMLDEVLRDEEKIVRDRLKPAIERVFDDTLTGIANDLREWLRRAAEDPSWTPAFFELSFGLKDRRAQDEQSKDDPVVLDCGVRLRGSIDLIERSDRGDLRATDYKTGKIRAKEGATVIGGGEVLQPVLYALTIEKLFPEATIQGGRLYYCTTAGDFTTVDIPLTDEARAAANVVGRVVGDALDTGFLPAAPAKDACKYCDFRPVCGPYEEVRVRRKQPDRLKPLVELRRQK